jgi:polar amino acid transport system substrate-binding protein
MGGRDLRLGITILVFALLVGSSILPQAQEPKYIVGTSADWPPFEWVDGAGNFVGFDMDVMRAIAILKGYEIEIKDMAFDALIPALQACTIDIIAAGLTITAERDLVIDYTEPYWEADQGVLVREDSGLNVVTALCCGAVVGAQRGTTQAAWIEENLVANPAIDVTLELYETNDAGIADLVIGRIDSFVADTPVAKVFDAKYPVEMVGIIVTGEVLGFAVKEGDPEGLLPKLNEGMAELKAIGVWDNLVEAYFAGDLLLITECYANCRGYMETGDPAAYATCLAPCMLGK